jgi:hypothetical protein
METRLRRARLTRGRSRRTAGFRNQACLHPSGREIPQASNAMVSLTAMRLRNLTRPPTSWLQIAPSFRVRKMASSDLVQSHTQPQARIAFATLTSILCAIVAWSLRLLVQSVASRSIRGKRLAFRALRDSAQGRARGLLLRWSRICTASR